MKVVKYVSNDFVVDSNLIHLYLEEQMNNKFFKLGALLVVLMLFAAFNTFAQLSTVYVDVTNGSDTYSGANATNNPFGTGPVATINKGLTLVANNGTLMF